VSGEVSQDDVQVRVLFFGAARDVAQQNEVVLSFKNGLKASDAFEQIIAAYPGLRRFGRSLLFAVNQEYAALTQTIKAGDELAIFPPVSGGSGESKPDQPRNALGPLTGSDTPTASFDFFELTAAPLDVGAIARRVVLPQCGATVTLDGYAREWTRGRRTLYLVYEAYEAMALGQLRRITEKAHQQFEIAHVGIVHRTGRVNIGETSVVISVSATHRRSAFEACEWLIRELKRSVPIWKKEVFEDGEVWVEA
jgi:molybdopterin converting factor subunit 1